MPRRAAHHTATHPKTGSDRRDNELLSRPRHAHARDSQAAADAPEPTEQEKPKKKLILKPEDRINLRRQLEPLLKPALKSLVEQLDKPEEQVDVIAESKFSEPTEKQLETGRNLMLQRWADGNDGSRTPKIPAEEMA